MPAAESVGRAETRADGQIKVAILPVLEMRISIMKNKNR